jgi:hypothetical protein
MRPAFTEITPSVLTELHQRIRDVRQGPDGLYRALDLHSIFVRAPKPDS